MEFGAGRVDLRVRRIPFRRREETRGGFVDVVFPGREQLYVLPLAYGVPGFRARLEYDWRHSALQDVGRGGEANGAPPMIATIFTLLMLLSYKTRNTEFEIQRNRRGLRLLARNFVGAAFGNEEIYELAHGRIVCVADQRGCFTDLRYRPTVRSVLMWWDRVDGATLSRSWSLPTGIPASPARTSAR